MANHILSIFILLSTFLVVSHSESLSTICFSCGSECPGQSKCVQYPPGTCTQVINPCTNHAAFSGSYTRLPNMTSINSSQVLIMGFYSDSSCSKWSGMAMEYCGSCGQYFDSVYFWLPCNYTVSTGTNHGSSKVPGWAIAMIVIGIIGAILTAGTIVYVKYYKKKPTYSAWHETEDEQQMLE